MSEKPGKIIQKTDLGVLAYGAFKTH